ncbi:hypothetical protein GQ43DRAFT_441914 [Delitschia confertaspora ATCC 74209]|uniref:FAD-binding FR-type domain-containing protein n=1 Tax=Delitschia confertaspora ATCC 74209 TaxID=1513339 RepID=A0A9P4MXN4_9PLEO|nr:hypothetical protein GQ43DRAFT_441914 [Delitschia confertaspora ATCC 74209]
MAFGYEFINLNDNQKHERRVLLGWYASIAQWSALVILAVFQISFFFSWLADRALENARPSSPSFNKRGESKLMWMVKFRRALRRVEWWMKKPVNKNWGTRGEWVYGCVWTVWLLFLSINQTGNDYLHLTKRLGSIGASQLPLHYLLALKTPYSPVQWLTRLSHEQLKAHHQVLGRIIFFLFLLHASLYFTFFVLSGFLAKRIRDRDVILGLISIALFSIMSTTALGPLRRWNYRIFYITHITIAGAIIAPLYFHAHHIRPYIIEVCAVALFKQVLERFSLRTVSGTVKVITGTNIIEIRIPLTAGSSELKWKPGQHVYLTRPTGQSVTQRLYDSLLLRYQSNPFTIASIPAKDKELLLIARTRKGNTKKIAKLARSLASTTGSHDTPVYIPLTLDGPFGASTWLPDFTTFDEFLFVAGGVGATFIMPIYRNITQSGMIDCPAAPKVRFIWTVRKLADTKWAFRSSNEVEEEEQVPRSSVEVFVTRPSGPDLQAEEDAGSDIELEEDEQLLSTEEQMEKSRRGITLQTSRPEISSIVDSVVGKANGRVMVIACGPQSLMKELGYALEKWVNAGSDVYYHEETFGW